MNKSYTKLWTDDFDEQKCFHYDKKFKNQFEKNVKHHQQVEIIRPYVKEETRWLDFPIGTARIMRDIPLGVKHGYDISDKFLDYSQQLGIQCSKQDLFNPKLSERFDLITSMHTLFAFSVEDQKIILKNYSNLLFDNGILIVDMANKHFRKKMNNYDYADLYGNPDYAIVPKSNCFYRNDLQSLFDDVGLNIITIIPHDSIDNEKLIDILIRFRLYRIINKLYFLLHLYPIANWLSNMFHEESHSKFVVVCRKI